LPDVNPPRRLDALRYVNHSGPLVRFDYLPLCSSFLIESSG
jgi:hypothetical protein